MLFARDQKSSMRRVFRPGRGRAGAQDVPTSEDLFLYVHVPTRSDPSVAPPGCEALYVLVATPALKGAEDSPRDEQARVRAAVLDALDSRYLPGLSDHLVVEHSIGPEHFRDVLNTPRGSAFSLQPTLFQSGWFRPHNRSRAVKGLYLVGAGTHPGAGVPAVLASGKIAAELIAADQGAHVPRTTGGRAR
jgi:phytoene desaturase